MSAWSPAEVAGRAVGDVDPETVHEPHARMGSEFECHPCACGGFLWAPRTRPGPSVEAHNATPGHRRWWARVAGEWHGGASVILPDVWTPMCMTKDEFAAWSEMNRGNCAARAVAAERPCADCTLEYALEMRALWRCNGSPSEMEQPGSATHRRIA